MKWYYANQDQRRGPVEEAELDELVRSGMVRDDTLVWREGMVEWQTHVAARGPRIQQAVPDEMVETFKYCVQCGGKFSSGELVMIGPNSVCAICKPTFLQRMQEGGAAIGRAHYAGFWIRTGAKLIDGVLLNVVLLGINIIVGIVLGLQSLNPDTPPTPGLATLGVGLLFLVSIALSGAYEAWFLVNRGATIGKSLLGLKVIRTSGAPITWGLAIGRFFGTYLSSVTLGIGFIMAGFDDQKRALHDRICETRVIYTK